MRSFILVLALALVASPLEAQRARRERYKVSTEELAEYNDENLADVLGRNRTQWFQLGGNNQSRGDTCMSLDCQAVALLVYVGTQRQGDSSMLHYYKASDVKEIRYYKPDESMGRFGANNAYVIQLVLKETTAGH